MQKFYRKQRRREQREAGEALMYALAAHVALGDEEHPPRLTGRAGPVAVALGACDCVGAPVEPELRSALNKLGIG